LRDDGNLTTVVDQRGQFEIVEPNCFRVGAISAGADSTPTHCRRDRVGRSIAPAPGRGLCFWSAISCGGLQGRTA